MLLNTGILRVMQCITKEGYGSWIDTRGRVIAPEIRHVRTATRSVVGGFVEVGSLTFSTVGSAERSTDFPIDFCPIVSAGSKARGRE
jgi:hypothetical protein